MALEIATRFGIRLASTRDTSTWQLVRSGGKMGLCAPHSEGGYRVEVDVTEGPMARRVHTARRTDALPRAIGLHKRSTVSVVDATAGLGRDSIVLAHLGCTVTALERVPAFCALLQFAVDDLGAEIEVVRTDSVPWLSALGEAQAPDVVYLDPMFAEPGRSQVKKEMQACRILAEAPLDELELLEAARSTARDRVVVKRHRHSRPLTTDVSHSLTSDRVRFDVYLTTG